MDVIDAKVYSSTNALRKSTLELLNEYKYELKQMCGVCMDIGCGPGDITKNDLLPMLHSKATIIGVDNSINMLKYAKEKYQDEKRISFDQMDIQTFNLPAGYISNIDHIFSFYALQWCIEIRRTFQNIYDMLKPKGTVLISMLSHHNIYNIINNFGKDARYSKYIKHLPSLSQIFVEPQKEMEMLLDSIGYKISNCSIRKVETRYDNLNQFISMVMSLSMLFNDIPEQLKQQFKEDFTNEYKKGSEQQNQDSYWVDEYFIFVFYGFKDV